MPARELRLERAVDDGAVNTKRDMWTRLVWVAVYAIAMGLLEAICVIYLRRLFPVNDLGDSPIPSLERLRIEVIREVCTLVMLVAVAWLGGINARSRLACFFYAFGLWDIVYYAGLHWLSGWPAGFHDWDCLFLIPKPWYGPVLAPVLISAYFVAGCLWFHGREVSGAPLRWSVVPLLLQFVAFGLWYGSFVKDSAHITRFGYTGVSYSRLLFVLGMATGIAGLWTASRASARAIGVSGD